MTQDRYIILTGPPGSGKTTLLQQLRTRGFPVIAEPAREILAEQRSIEGNGVPEKDSLLFVELMLSRMMRDFRESDTATSPVFFDRGIPDLLAYAAHFGFAYPPGEIAARLYRYNPRVLFLPAWKQIYATDEERKMPFEMARQFGDELQGVYTRLGYSLIAVPCISVEERIEFILNAHHPVSTQNSAILQTSIKLRP